MALENSSQPLGNSSIACVMVSLSIVTSSVRVFASCGTISLYDALACKRKLYEESHERGAMPTSSKDYIWIQEAAKEFHRSRASLDDQVLSGTLTVAKFKGDRRVYLRRSELDTMLA